MNSNSLSIIDFYLFDISLYLLIVIMLYFFWGIYNQKQLRIFRPNVSGAIRCGARKDTFPDTCVMMKLTQSIINT